MIGMQITDSDRSYRKRERALSHSSGNLYPSMNRRRETECLIKQTYSVHVSLPSDAARRIIRKWHLSESHRVTVDGTRLISSSRLF